MEKSYDKISTYFRLNWPIVLPLCFTGLLFNGLMCLLPLLEGKAIDSLRASDYQQVKKWAILFILMVLFVQMNRFFKRFCVRILANRITITMRKVSMDHLLKTEVELLSSANLGDILNRNLSDINETAEGIRKITTEVFDTFVLLMGYLISMFFLDWQITLWVIGFIVVAIGFAQWMKGLVYKTNKEYKEYLSCHKQMTITQIGNQLYYRGFGVEENYDKQYSDSVHALEKKQRKAQIFQSSLEPIYQSIALLGVLIILYFGGTKVMDGTYLIGTLVAYLSTYLLVSRKAARAGKVFNAYQGFKVSWQRVQKTLLPVDSYLSTNQFEGEELVLRDFAFQYPHGFVLPRVNMVAKKGQVIGVVGRVHCGKSTLLRALSGLYTYQGSAILSGVELLQVKKDKEQIIAYCPTKVSLFADSCENNITLNREGNFEKAISDAELEMDLEDIGGRSARLSRTNANISGGQKQRLQLARTFYRPVKLMLLDNPFSGVEKEQANKMFASILDRSRDCIVFLVTNNPEYLKKMSQIVFLTDNDVKIDSYNELSKNTDFNQLMEATNHECQSNN